MLFALLVASLCESVSIPQEFAKDIVSKRFWDWVKHHVIPGIPARKIVSTKNEDEEGLKWKKDFKIGPVDGKVDIDIPFPWEKNAEEEEGLKWKKDFKIGPVDGKVDIDIPFPWERMPMIR